MLDKKNSGNKPHEVGTKQPNDFGLYDMHGNVWEWVQDRYGGYQSGSVTNPTGTSSGSLLMIRGGSWVYTAEELRSANRYASMSHFYFSLGFRLLKQ